MNLSPHSSHGPNGIETGIANNLFKVLFGETAFYVGESLNAMPERRRANVVRIANNAVRRLGARIADAGQVPPRIVGAIFGDGSYCEDHLACEYWGGIVACSRTANHSDDRGLRLLKTLASLTVHQIRTHYLFYATLRRLLTARPRSDALDFDSQRYRMAAFVPAAAYRAGMGFNDAETLMMPALAGDALAGLGMEALLDGSNTGQEEYLKRFFKSDVIRGEGIVFAPSLPGIRLFLWAFGAGARDARHYVEPGFACAVEGVPGFLEGSGLVYDD